MFMIKKIWGKYFFDIYKISTCLGYSKSRYLYDYYCKKNENIKITTGKNITNKYVGLEDTIKILNRTKKFGSKILIGEIFESVCAKHNIILPNRFEDDLFKSIKDFFENTQRDIDVIQSYECDDMYSNIVIRRKDYDMYETLVIISRNKFKRNGKIAKFPASDFAVTIHVNPYDKDFSIGKLIKQIMRYI